MISLLCPDAYWEAIEDDIVVTAEGYENLSAHIPTGADEVEAWMAQLGVRS